MSQSYSDLNKAVADAEAALAAASAAKAAADAAALAAEAVLAAAVSARNAAFIAAGEPVVHDQGGGIYLVYQPDGAGGVVELRGVSDATAVPG